MKTTRKKKLEIAISWARRYFIETGQEQPGVSPRCDGKLRRHVDPYTLACRVCRDKDSKDLCTTGQDAEAPVCLYGLFATATLQDNGLTSGDIAKRSTFKEAVILDSMTPTP
mmetsp:Transcript_3802/g.11800  ORF Transcript_3802/g.11800 Transcript_3802/m.11800 type:complete len:112 (+) Transcript_3802:1101-1436(+)